MQAVLPVDVKHIKSHIPCEGCGVKNSKYKATLNPPGRASVTHRFCENCIGAIDQR